jgi:hypothetical protein
MGTYGTSITGSNVRGGIVAGLPFVTVTHFQLPIFWDTLYHFSFLPFAQQRDGVRSRDRDK